MIYLFQSLDFVLFFIFIFIIYWSLPQKIKNYFLLFISYLFYISWDSRFLLVLFLSSVFSYITAYFINKSHSLKRKKLILKISLLYFIAQLIFFKNAGFFQNELIELLDFLNISHNDETLKVILPIGLSFYTFQILSYLIDLYKGTTEFIKRPSQHFLFISYFPQILAGPIEKSQKLIPQLLGKKNLSKENIRKGLYLFIYGFVCKAVFSDSLVPLVQSVFQEKIDSSVDLWIGLYAFAFQLYLDFSGYSKMARGISLLLGIELSVNFNLPFFSKNYFDFYKRWHITLCDWIAEYVYQPLNKILLNFKWGGHLNTLKYKMLAASLIALFFTRLCFGLWHGTSWSFLMLALFIYLMQVLTLLIRYLFKYLNIFQSLDAKENKLFRIAKSFIMFHIFSLAMIFFIVQDFSKLILILPYVFGHFNESQFSLFMVLPLLSIAAFVYVYEYFQYKSDDQFWICQKGFMANLVFYTLLIIFYVNLGMQGSRDFIYFKF